MTYCFCQTSENSELMVQGSSTHARKLATVLLKRNFFITNELSIKSVDGKVLRSRAEMSNRI